MKKAAIKDYYSALEIWPKSSEGEIKKSYFRLAKLYHPDVAGDIPENRERFKIINEAFSVLSDPQKRREYDEKLRKTSTKPKDRTSVQANDRRGASLAYQNARDAMRVGRYDKAVLLLKSAIRFDANNPLYYSWYGFCLAMSNSNLHEARDACRKAIEIEFYNADYHANLGFVYFKAGLKNLAVKHFSDAIKWDPENAVAKKFMTKVDGGEKIYEQGPIDKFLVNLKKLFIG